MSRSAEEILARARALIGVRFRLQGRSAETGLDCVGLVAEAIGAEKVPSGYALRGGSAEELAANLEAEGLEPVAAIRAGDVLAMVPGPAQLHLGIFTGDGLVHGDAGLGRVVERPGRLPWPISGSWRVRGG
jgi:lipoprotein Spr